jgi:ribonucleoside-diphosphate reductase alpha chain
MGSKKVVSSYLSNFNASAKAVQILISGKILAENETPKQMIERVVNTLVDIENNFNTRPKEMKTLAKQFGFLLDNKYCVMSTPILTNAGRYTHKPLSACTIPPIDLLHDDIKHITKIISKMHRDGMGTGFSLDETPDPVLILKKLNQIAVAGSLSGKEDRPVGNMATLTVYHPKITDFILVKNHADDNNEEWKFNISINCDAGFFRELSNNGSITLTDGKKIEAKIIFDLISRTAHKCADPGLLFLERMDNDNPLPGLGHYTSTAPCAEVGLIKGESCQFGYINLAKFIKKSGEIDIKKIKQTTRIMTRMLDNALEISIHNYSGAVGKHVMYMKRKIGIGICGLADLLIKKGILYESNEARLLALDIITLINFESKKASHELAKIRGSFLAMYEPTENKHLMKPSFIERKYSNLCTKYVKSKEWMDLSDKILNTKCLRNCSTTALPPTGRSAVTIDASTGIEPVFSYQEYLVQHPEIKKNNYKFVQTAMDISSEGHLHMAAFVQRGVDESISKTINLTSTKTPKQIQNIYMAAWSLGLKGITIYREGSKKFQPKKLS